MTGGAPLPALPLPDPPIRTPRLLLRPWSPDDADALVEAWADPEVQRWTGAPEHPDRSRAAAWIRRTQDLRTSGRSLDLVIDVDGEVAGEVGLVPGTEGRARAGEIGWWLLPRHRGQGLAAEAVRAFVAWSLDPGGLGLDHVEAWCDTANPRSGRVAGAAGFELVDRSDVDGRERWRAGPRPGGGTLHP